ncbi:acyltransferase [Heliobacterium chlorum]|uniref:Acyltransferase n=1 Tax=Heliobacterium chlorum TaxID=2698 RepID=A0ABR7T1J4_HELCL|nr:acyltransferase [Heliobacterium chlorum]MBC9784655.1 acyltransferase [Heliobacterium chlorum]
MKTKTYLGEVQILRGLAFIGVAFQHTLGPFMNQQGLGQSDAILLTILFNLAKFAVPLFVFMTGMVIFYNYYDTLEYPSFIVRRTKEVIIPYLVWSLIYVFHGVPFPQDFLFFIRDVSQKILTGSTYYHLWFIVMIYQFYIVYPFFRSAAKQLEPRLRSEKSLILLMASLGAVYLGLTWLSSSVIPHLDNLSGLPKLWSFFSEYRDRTFIFWFFYFILGGLAGLAVTQWRAWVEKTFLANSLLCLLLFILVTYEMWIQSYPSPAGYVVNFNVSTSLKPSMALFSVSAIIFLYGLTLRFTRESNRVTAYLDRLGKHSFGAYLVHALTLEYTARVVYKFMQPLAIAPKIVIILAGCVICAYYFSVIINRTPLAAYIVGSGAKRKKFVSGSDLPRSTQSM